MPKIRKAVWLFLFSCMLLSSITVRAADERLGTVVDGSLLTDSSTVQVTVPALLRGVYLADGYGALSLNSKRNVNVAGYTSCYRTSDEVKVTLHLQRLKGDSWVTVYTLGPKVAYDTYYVSNSKNYDVTGGYYYRVSGSHTAIKGSTVESVSSYTNGGWID